MDSNVEKFTFTWRIENLICTSSADEVKTSSFFKTHILEDTEWELQLLVSIKDCDRKFNVLLHRSDGDDGPEILQIDFGIYFFVNGGSSNFKMLNKCVKFSKGKAFLTKPRWLFKDDFVNDTITLKCVLWKSYANDDDDSSNIASLNTLCILNDDSINKMHEDSCKQLKGINELCNVYPNRCTSVTRFKVEKRSLIYHFKQFASLMNDFSASIPFTSTSGINSLLLTFLLKKDSDNVEIFVRTVEEDIDDFLYVKCKILALSKVQSSLCLVEDTNVFKPKYDTIWKTNSFQKSLLMEDRGVYLRDGILSLQIDLSIYDGQMETDTREVGFAEPPKFEDDSRTLADELFQFFKNQSFCDITLQTKEDKIQAHKIVVCAKSPVFRAMFENEMSEKVTKVVDILDTDMHTLKRMLTYMYCETFETILSEYDAMKLYSVADKYQYDKLMRKCSDFLKSNLLKANVCEVLELADIHQDGRLKLAALFFMKSKLNEILLSDEWKNLINNNIHLATETLVYLSSNIA